MRINKIVIGALALLWAGMVGGQSINSPYSNNGVGELLFQGLPHNSGMGEVGIAMPTPWHINLQNPSLLINNTFSSFQVGLIGDFRRHENATASDNANSAGLRFLAMSFPVVKNRWTSSFALLPLSTVNYKTFSQNDQDLDVLEVTQFEGDGGLSNIAFSNAFRIYKSLSLGIKASYIFGTIDRRSRIQLIDEQLSNDYEIAYVEETSYSDYSLSFGLSYRHELKEDIYLNMGATYDPLNNLSGSEERLFERWSLNGSVIQVQPIDDGGEFLITLPESVGVGFSYEKLNNYSLGLDIKQFRWESANDESSGGVGFRNTVNVAMGAAWTPDYQNVNSYLKRATYRFGISMKQLPYLVNNTEINDFGINFGASFPVSGFSSMDAAFKYGFRGTTDNGLIRENYFQVIIGATINDRWFIKRRYD